MAPQYDRVHIMDARYTYEHVGGHIPGAVNITHRAGLKDLFFGTSDGTSEGAPGATPDGTPEGTPVLGASEGSPLSGTPRDGPRVLVVFHCEFSEVRGPALCKYMREQDRLHHGYKHFPKLSYPEMYILKGGYKAWFNQYPSLCQPSAYVPMVAQDMGQARSAKRARPSSKRGRSWRAPLVARNLSFNECDDSMCVNNPYI